MLESLVQVQTVRIGTEDYRLVEVQGEFPRLAWDETYEDESAWQGGTPNILFDPSSTWHLGGFKAMDGIPGSTEYGISSDCRWPNRIAPGPKVNQITLTDSDATPTSFFEALGQLFVCAGRRVFRINPSGDVVTASKDFGSGYVAVEGLRWDADQAIVAVYYGAGPSCLLYRLIALGTPDDWAFTDAEAYRLAAGTDRLFKVNHEGLLKNCLTGKNPTDEQNWADEVQCGDTDELPNALVAFERTALVGKPDGLFGVSEEGKGIPLISRMAPDSSNCYGMHVVDPYVFVPHIDGCYRFMPGFVEALGIEREVLNDNPDLMGWFRGFTVRGPWVFGVLFSANGATRFICTGREATEGEPTLGPYIWDTLINQTDDCQAIHVSHLWDPPRVFYGKGNNVGYFKLANAGGAPDIDHSDYEFVTSATRFTRRYNFGSWLDKDFNKVEIAVKGATSSYYWVVSYRVNDTGSYSNLDAEGNVMKADTDGLHTFYLPSTAKGREIQYKFEYTGAAATAKAEIVHFKPFAVPSDRKLRHYNLTLLLAAELRHDGGVEQRRAVDQLNDLNALTEDPLAVVFNGPWGDKKAHPKRVRVLEVRQEGHEQPRFLVELVAQERREA